MRILDASVAYISLLTGVKKGFLTFMIMNRGVTEGLSLNVFISMALRNPVHAFIRVFNLPFFNLQPPFVSAECVFVAIFIFYFRKN